MRKRSLTSFQIVTKHLLFFTHIYAALNQAPRLIFLYCSLHHVGYCKSPATMPRMFPAEEQTRRRLWRMSEEVRGHQLTSTRGCPMTTEGCFYASPSDSPPSLTTLVEPEVGKDFFFEASSSSSLQLLKRQECSRTPAAVPLRSIEQRGHPKLVG